MIRCRTLLVIALMLLSLTVALAEFSSLASGNPTMFRDLFGEKAPNGIKINSDGSVEGTDMIQANGNTYTLTGDLDVSITILHDEVILDGNGHTLRGNSDQIGVFLQGRNGVTIKNLAIEGFAYGIKLTWLDSPNEGGKTVTITGNVFSGNTNGIAFLEHMAGSNISDNYFTGNTYAVSNPTNITFRGNHFIDNDYCISDGNDLNDVDTSNTVDNKPVYYWINQQDKVVPSNAGWVALKNCKNITVQGLNLNRSGDGLALYNTVSSTIKSNVIANNAYGISLHNSNGNAIVENKIVGSKNYGIYLTSSSNNSIARNQINEDSEGVRIEYGYNNTINQNEITANSLAGLFASTLHANNVTDITLVSQNIISKNGIGVWVYGGSSLTIVLNNITDNLDWGMKLESSQKDNIIHHNNFVDNNVTEKLQVCITGFWNQTFDGGKINGTYRRPQQEFVAGMANVWDNGMEGNYWSDYTTRYSNATEIGKTGVGDTPFYINENNIDSHPLTAPVDISNTNLLSPNQEPSGSDTPQNPFLSLTVLLAIASVAIVGIGLAVFFKKRRN